LFIDRDIANGFLIILDSGKPNDLSPASISSAENNADDEAAAVNSSEVKDESSLAFFALTEGNIVEACYNVRQLGTQLNGSNFAVSAVKKTKDVLRQQEDNEAIKLLAVESYKNCFLAVIQFHNEMDQLGVISRCMKSKSIRDKAGKSIKSSFDNLKDAVSLL